MARIYQPSDERPAAPAPGGPPADEAGRPASAEPWSRVQIAALEAAANAIVITDSAGRIVWVNRAFTQSSGYTSAEAIGHTPRLLNAGLQDPTFFADLWNTILSGQVWHGEITNRRQSGELYTEDMTITPVADAEGVISHFIAIKQDISERKRAEAERLRLYEAEQRARAEAQEAVRAREEFLSVAAHELKTPVTSLRGFAQLTLRQLDRGGALDLARLRRALQAVDQQSEKLSRLVTQLLDVSRIEAGKLALTPSLVDVGGLVADVVTAVRAAGAQQDLQLRVAATRSVLGDPLRLEQVIANLLDNAIKYSPRGSTIEIEVQAPRDDLVSVAVRDRGIGVPPAHRARIFEPFYQVHAPGHYPGMGLGLYISHQIVELHHGQLEAEFPEGGGTRLILTLPTDPAGPARVPAAVVAADSARVLLIDDDEGIRGFVSLVLADEGYTAGVAANGAAGLVAAREAPPDLILLDTRMPLMDGPAFVRAYREGPGPHAPIVLLTGSAEPPREAAEMGADGFLAKPFNVDDLLALVARFIKARPARSPRNR